MAIRLASGTLGEQLLVALDANNNRVELRQAPYFRQEIDRSFESIIRVPSNTKLDRYCLVEELELSRKCWTGPFSMPAICLLKDAAAEFSGFLRGNL